MIVNISLKGSMINETSRHDLGPYLTLHFTLAALQFSCSIFGVCLFASHSVVPCDGLPTGQHVASALVLVTVVTQIADVMILTCCFNWLYRWKKVEFVNSDSNNSLSFLNAPSKEDLKITVEEEDVLKDYIQGCFKTFFRCTQLCSCSVSGEDNVGNDIQVLEIISVFVLNLIVLQMVADLITPLFHHDGFLDVVPSDVVAGIVLVRAEQRACKVRYEAAPTSSLSSFSVVESVTDTDLERRVSLEPAPSQAGEDLDYGYFSPVTPSAMEPEFHRLSGYKLKQLAHSTPLTPANEDDFSTLKKISLFARYSLAAYTQSLTRCCNYCLKDPKFMKFDVESGDGCSFDHHELKRFTRKLNSKCVFATYENNSRARTYAVFADAARRTVVISIRGTHSLEDCLADLNAQVETFIFEDKLVSAHQGMLRSAKHTLQDILSRDLIQKAVTSLDTSCPSHHKQSDAYELILTGHSLGAGVAVLLTFLLKATYPQVRCYSFGTPGTCVDRTTAASCRDFITSVCLGSDIVCRLSIRSFSLLREEILDAVSRAKVNKIKIIQSLFRDSDVDELLMKTAPDSEFKRVMLEYNEKMLAEVARLNPVPLYIPGKIIHFVKLRKVGRCFGKKSVFAPQYTQPEEFEEIHVSPTMAWDHLLDRYVEEIDHVLEQWVRREEEN